MFSTHNWNTGSSRISSSNNKIPDNTCTIMDYKQDLQERVKAPANLNYVKGSPKITPIWWLHDINSPWNCIIQKTGILLIKHNRDIYMLDAALKSS
jgi:hypothetical protein